MKHGFLLIDKPPEMTSHDVVQEARNRLHEPKIGHLGTLDPLATGLLVLAVGRKALKVVELFSSLTKQYEARITFGAVSSTYDREGVIEEQAPKPGWTPPTDAKLQEALSTFVGKTEQQPPAHSAVHIHGKRAYSIIRDDPDVDITMPTRTVHINRIQLISYRYPECCIDVTCSSGTYIRSLAHDLGQKLRCGAYLTALKRTAVGQWSLEDAHALKTIAWGQILPLKEVLASFTHHDLTETEWQALQHGQSIDGTIAEEPLIGWYDDLPVALLEQDKKSVHKLHPRKVF